VAVETERLSPAEHLERRIAALDAEVAQIRNEYGDPTEALGVYLRERFGIAAIMQTYEEYLRHEDSFLYDDYEDDVDDRNGDGGTPR
jgi:RNA binding exosome subunit